MLFRINSTSDAYNSTWLCLVLFTSFMSAIIPVCYHTFIVFLLIKLLVLPSLIGDACTLKYTNTADECTITLEVRYHGNLAKSTNDLLYFMNRKK